MFYFEVCSCPKCRKRGTFLPSFEKTLTDFLDDYDQGALLVLDESKPPSIPTYIIFTCEDGCGYSVKMSDLEALEFLRSGWAQVAWEEWQRSVRSASEFDKNFTRYLFDGTLGKFVTQETLDRNPLLKDYMRLIQDNEKKKST